MNRRNLIKSLSAIVIASPFVNAQSKTKSNPSAKMIASDLLKLANKIQSSQLSKSDRDKYSEIIEELSGKIQKEYNTGALLTNLRSSE